MGYQGKVVAVTGGAGVLCGAFCRFFAAQGAKVAILDRAIEPAQALADEINAAGGTAIAVFIDVLDADKIQAAYDTVLQQLGPVDILINGAGGNSPRATTTSEVMGAEDLEPSPDRKSFFDLNRADVGFVFDLNFLGTLLPTQVFARGMAEAKRGCVLNVSSMNAFRPLTKIPAYSGAKAAVSNFTQWLAVHLAGVNIRVNAIAPGFFVTDQNRALLQNPDGTPTARSQKILTATPMSRYGEAGELLGALEWLCDDEKASFVTGIVVPVDGGFSAYSGV